jgi:TolA-binding protein
MMARTFALCALLLLGGMSQAGPLDEMSLDRWAKLREVERYQLNIAEKLYREKSWKIAADEYEKFLKLYERSVGAPYAQLKWSLCQVELRNLNTAIKDGYQSVIDYYPDSPEAVTSALLIGRTYKDMGDLKMAKKAYDKLLKTHPKHYIAVLARLDLADVALKEKDDVRRAAILRELTYDVERKGAAAQDCVTASIQLAQLCFYQGDFAEGIKALGTTYGDNNLPHHLMSHNYGHLPWVLQHISAQPDEDSKKKTKKLADDATNWVKAQASAAQKDEKLKVHAQQWWFYAPDIQGYARQPEKQREVYDQMVKALGESDAVLGKVAGWYWDTGKRELARATCAKFKDVIEGQRLVANYWREDGKPDPAIEIYRKLSVQDEKNRPKWLGEIAWTYRHRAGKADLAIATYRDLISTDVKNTASYQWQIADTLQQYSRWAEAITVYRGTDNFPESYKRMATCNRNLKKYDEAITLYRQVMGGSKDLASWALLEIARTYEEAGKKDDAIKTFKLVCDRFPKSGEGSWSHAHLNDVYKISVTLGGAKD